MHIVVVGIRPNNPQRFVLYTNYQMPTLHVSQCRHVGDDIILLMTAEVILQVLEFLPLATLILFGVLFDEILL
ncbi:MAG: hypothetical protein J5905_05540 [Prevotella sp.]|nr:hypothetical protein [Prevotella sp.]